MTKSANVLPMSAVRRALCRFLGTDEKSTSGVAAIELALVAPILVLLAVSTIDLGLAFYRKMQVQNAVHAGVAYAMLHGFTPSEITDAVTGATSYSGIRATPAPAQSCGCASAGGIAPAACGATCSGGVPAGTYVTVYAQAAHDTLVSYPILAQTYTFSAQSTVRIK